MFGYGSCGGMGAVGWLLMTLLWGGLLAVIVWAIMRIFPRGRSRPAASGGADSAGSTLDRRLAAGEIDEDTYLRLHADLTHAG